MSKGQMIIDRILKDEPSIVKKVFPGFYNHFVLETAHEMLMKAGLDDFDFIGGIGSSEGEERMGKAMVHMCELLAEAVEEIWTSAE